MSEISDLSHFPQFSTLLTDFFAQNLASSEEIVSDPHLPRLIEEVNKFLGLQGKPAFSPTTTDHALRDFPARLRDFLDSLNQNETVLNSGGEAENATASFKAQSQMRELFFAVAEYLQQHKTPIMSYGNKFDFPASSPEKMRIWKREVVRQPNGDFTSSLKEVEQINFSRKPVISVGGLSCFHDNPEALAGFLKMAEKTLGGPNIHQEGIELYLLSHPVLPKTYFQGHTYGYNADPAYYTSPAAQDFVQTQLLPMLGLAQEDKAVPLTQLKERLGKCNFFAFSYGTVFVKEVGNELTAALLKRGYQETEVRSALAEVYSMNLGATCRIDVSKPCGNFSSVYVVSEQDLVARSRTNTAHFLKGKDLAQPVMVKVSENELLVWTNTPRAGVLSEIPGACEKGKGNDTGLSTVSEPTGHRPNLYTGRIIGAGRLSDPSAVEYSLRHAARGRRGRKLEETMQPLRLCAPQNPMSLSDKLPFPPYIVKMLEGIIPQQKPPPGR